MYNCTRGLEVDSKCTLYCGSYTVWARYHFKWSFICNGTRNSDFQSSALCIVVLVMQYSECMVCFKDVSAVLAVFGWYLKITHVKVYLKSKLFLILDGVLEVKTTASCVCFCFFVICESLGRFPFTTCSVDLEGKGYPFNVGKSHLSSKHYSRLLLTWLTNHCITT